jgi:hypothetical protein
METDSDYDEQYDSEDPSDASMDSADDDDYFDTTADTQHRKVSMQQLAATAGYCCCWLGLCAHASTTLVLHMQTKYIVLTKDDIKTRQQEVVDSVTSVLGISSEDAGRILRKYKW